MGDARPRRAVLRRDEAELFAQQLDLLSARLQRRWVDRRALAARSDGSRFWPAARHSATAALACCGLSGHSRRSRGRDKSRARRPPPYQSVLTPRGVRSAASSPPRRPGCRRRTEAGSALLKAGEAHLAHERLADLPPLLVAQLALLGAQAQRAVPNVGVTHFRHRRPLKRDGVAVEVLHRDRAERRRRDELPVGALALHRHCHAGAVHPPRLVKDTSDLLRGGAVERDAPSRWHARRPGGGRRARCRPHARAPRGTRAASPSG